MFAHTYIYFFFFCWCRRRYVAFYRGVRGDSLLVLLVLSLPFAFYLYFPIRLAWCQGLGACGTTRSVRPLSVERSKNSGGARAEGHAATAQPMRPRCDKNVKIQARVSLSPDPSTSAFLLSSAFLLNLLEYLGGCAAGGGIGSGCLGGLGVVGKYGT